MVMDSKKKTTRSLSPELASALEMQQEAFRQKFGRDPGPDDPVFFDPDADTPQPLDADEVDRQIIDAMAKAEMDPSYIYAYHKTGLLVTDENLRSLSVQDVDEWMSAVKEYKEKIKGTIS